jgi:hypothetical protein
MLSKPAARAKKAPNIFFSDVPPLPPLGCYGCFAKKLHKKDY